MCGLEAGASNQPLLAEQGCTFLGKLAQELAILFAYGGPMQTVAVSSSQSALKGNQAAFQIGYRTNVDVLTAQQQLFSARSGLSKARYEALLQGLKLKAAAGMLFDADLEVIARRMQ